jgi:dynein regulatory complex protein 1
MHFSLSSLLSSLLPHLTGIPQELYGAISLQYKKASGLLLLKDELIKFLQTTLRSADEDYVEVLSQHQEDMNLILSRMGSSFTRFLTLVAGELRVVERVFLKEREERVASNREAIEALFDKRRKMEVVIMDSKQARERKCAQELVEIRNRDAEDYNSLKIDLENSIQIFEQQLEEMRATYQLNSEKLEYNHRYAPRAGRRRIDGGVGTRRRRRRGWRVGW